MVPFSFDKNTGQRQQEDAALGQMQWLKRREQCIEPSRRFRRQLAHPAQRLPVDQVIGLELERLGLAAAHKA